ncbi:CueP family metal-binding protein [Actinotalea sp. BY-33]|uniref:CueP family metal-binding protein n=1 Tax=Actinotalea soli TaxID=2819234 RepID=A0A939LPC3_9CELL|nr:CueP family metal-binding protein [Actinotalea soli]MBO1751786.1 CueP family metal-binding protein [Actinotalea soli]
MMRRPVLAAAALALVLAGCSSAAPETTPAPETDAAGQALLERHGLEGMDTREVIDHLDRLGGEDRPSTLMASVRADELLLTEGEEELSLEMPAEELYVAVAPYVDQTHDCAFHSLTTCQGELAEREVEVTILDDSGAVLVEETTTTYANGFVGYWLPRDVEGTIEMTVDGQRGEVPFTTADDGLTCLTTLQMT